MDPEVEQMLKALYGAISEEDGRWVGRHRNHRLRSHFQPIYSFPHRRPVGYEGLIRVFSEQGEPLSPVAAFEQVGDFREQVMLDRLCRLLHVLMLMHDNHRPLRTGSDPTHPRLRRHVAPYNVGLGQYV